MNGIYINSQITINFADIFITFIRGSGPGGQNVNKVATAAQLRFNVLESLSLPDEVRLRLANRLKLTSRGELIIKGMRYRTQERNRQDVIERFRHLIQQALVVKKKRKATKPTAASRERRLLQKKKHGYIKKLRKME